VPGPREVIDSGIGLPSAGDAQAPSVSVPKNIV
jgi:hypothetical protein